MQATEFNEPIEPVVPPVKPGWQTTEFWIQLASVLLGFGVSFGLLTSDKADAALKVVASVAAAAFSIWGAVGYSRERAAVKVAQQMTAGKVMMMRAAGQNRPFIG